METTINYKHHLGLELLVDRWNEAEKCAQRLTVMRSILQGAETVALGVPRFTSLLKDLDLDLLNRDLGWDRDSVFIGEIDFYAKGIDRLGLGLKQPHDAYFFSATISRKGAPLIPPAGRQEGEFMIALNGDGSLINFTVFKHNRPAPRPISEEPLQLFEPANELDLLDPDLQYTARQQAAELADLLLVMLKQRGVTLSEISPSQGRL